MELAKPFIDVGVYTNQLDAQLHFWQHTAGLPFDELLKLGGGVHQHRHNLAGSVLKLNHVRDPLGTHDSSGITKLLIADETVEQVTALCDHDGNQVDLVPPGTDDVTQIGIVLTVNSIEEFAHFYRHILQIEELSPTKFRWGSTIFLLKQRDTPQAPMQDMRGAPGFRYLTVQVFAVDREHKRFVSRGGTSAMEPATLGSTARISFIKDPDGNWIEISQRASLTGSLDIIT